MTVPAETPEWFDSSYAEGKAGEHYFTEELHGRMEDNPMQWANVFVPSGVPVYPKVCELIQSGEPRESRSDPDGRSGLWVSLRIAIAAGAHF